MSKITRSRWSDEENTALAKAYINCTSAEEFLNVMLTEGKRPLRTIKAYTTQVLKTPTLRDKNETLHDALNTASAIEAKRLKAEEEAANPTDAPTITEVQPPTVPTGSTSPTTSTNWIDQVDLGPAESAKKGTGFQSNFVKAPNADGDVLTGFQPGRLIPKQPHLEVHLDGRHPTPLAPDAKVEISGTSTSTPVAAPNSTYVEDWVVTGIPPRTGVAMASPFQSEVHLKEGPPKESGPPIEELLVLVGGCHDIIRGNVFGTTAVNIRTKDADGWWGVDVQDCPVVRAKSLRGALILSLVSVRNAARATLLQIENLVSDFLPSVAS